MAAEVLLDESSNSEVLQKAFKSCPTSVVSLTSPHHNVQEGHKNGITRFQKMKAHSTIEVSTIRDSKSHTGGISLPHQSSVINPAKRLSESTTDIANVIHRNTSQLFAISSFAPLRRSTGSIQAFPGSDPVLDTITQLNAEDRTDRDLCCGLFASFRSALKALWMLFSVAVVYSGFMGPYECQKITLVPVFVTVFGFILMLYMVLGEIAGAVAIWKGRRIGLCILALSQIFLAVWIVFGYFALPIVHVDYGSGDNVTLEVQIDAENGVTNVSVDGRNYSGNCQVPHLCGCVYFNYMMSLFGLAHLVLVFVLIYTLVVCVCVTKAAHEVRKHNRTSSPNKTPPQGDQRERMNSIVVSNGGPPTIEITSTHQEFSSVPIDMILETVEQSIVD